MLIKGAPAITLANDDQTVWSYLASHIDGSVQERRDFIA